MHNLNPKHLKDWQQSTLQVITWLLVAGLAVGVLWAVLAAIDPIWWALIILPLFLATGIWVWKKASTQAKEFVTIVNETPLLKGVFVVLILTAIYGFVLFWLYRGILMINESLGVEFRMGWIIAAAIGLPAIPLLWYLYAAAGLPGDAKTVGRGFRGVAFFTLIFFAWWYYDQPNRMFDVETGQATFWVAKEEGKIYFFPGAEDTTKKYFSPVTGEELERGNSDDAKKYRRESWVKEASAFIPSFNTKVEPSSPQIRRIPVVLRGEKILSEPVDVPKGKRWYVVGPSAEKIRLAKIHFGDGKSGPLGKWYEGAISPYRFSGPKGEIIFVDIFL